MNEGITVINGGDLYNDDIKRIISVVYEPIRKENIGRLGIEISDGLDVRWQMPCYKAIAEKNEILAASHGERIIGFTAYRIVGDMLVTDYTVSESDEVSCKLYNETVKIAKKNGCKYAKIHAVTDKHYVRLYGNYHESGYNMGLESVMYFMPLSQRVKKKINEAVSIVPASEKYLDDVMRITVSAWNPIRVEQKRILGDKLYTRLFEGWEERKCLEVKNDFLADGRGERYGYAALIDGRVAGFVTRLKSPTADYMGIVGNNAVSPEFAGMGIGSAMYDHILSKMEEGGMTHVGVFTGRDNAHAPARRAYERMGFTPENAINCADYYAIIE